MVSISSKSEVSEFSGEAETPITGGHTFDLWCPFSNPDEQFQSNVMCENLLWIGRNRRYVNLREGRGQKPPIRGVTCDLRCPFSNLPELFQSKVMCENLVRIGWAFQELSCPQKKKKVMPLGFNPPGGGLTIIESIWNSGNLPYLVANTYG